MSLDLVNISCLNVICCVIRNALSLAMLESIKERLTHDVNSADLRVTILRANGPVFSSGHNLKELVSWIHRKTLPRTLVQSSVNFSWIFIHSIYW